MNLANGIGASSQGQQAIFVDAATNCLYTLNPANGQPIWIVDYETGQPMVNRQLFVEPSSGYLCTTSLSGTGYVWVISPITGQPVPQALPQSQAFSQPQNPMQTAAQTQGQAYGQMQQATAPTGSQIHEQAQQAQTTYQSPTTQQAQAYGQTQSLYQMQVENPMQTFLQSQPQEETLSRNPEQKPGEDVRSAIADEVEQPRKVSGMAILAAVLGLVAIGIYFIPPIEVGSFFVAALGAIVSIAGIISACRGKKGLVLALAGAVFSIAAIVLVIMTQSAFSTMLDQVSNAVQQKAAPAASTSVESGGSTEGNGTDASANANQAIDYNSLAIGQSATPDGKLSVSIIRVRTGLKGENDKVTGITVKYLNKGDATASIDTANWKAINDKGKTEGTTTSKDGSAKKEALKTGNLEPGKSAIGTIYFEGTIEKVLYLQDATQAEPSATWIL